MIGNGPIDSRPLNAQVVVTTPKKRPVIACQRFHPRYGMLVGAPACRYRFLGEYIQTMITTPISAATVPMSDDQTTNENHSRLMLAKRREVEPVRNRTEIGPEP